jgi:hypothetical protein
MIEESRRPRFRFRISTILLVVAIVALVVVVAVQQAQIGRMRQMINAGAKERDQLTTILREMRDRLERRR